MQKTPDKIKKGLACCAASIYQCEEDCPYREECRNGQGGKAMMEDAFALLQQKEQENAEQAERIKQLEKRVIHLEALNQSNLTTITMQERTRARLQERISQLEAERDALMYWAKGRCDTCAHKDDCVKHDPDPEGYVMRWYDDCEIWEWRGVQKEE